MDLRIRELETENTRLQTDSENAHQNFHALQTDYEYLQTVNSNLKEDMIGQMKEMNDKKEELVRDMEMTRKRVETNSRLNLSHENRFLDDLKHRTPLRPRDSSA